MHTHVEYEDDHTEHEVGVIVGYTDPHDQTGSDDEVMPLADWERELLGLKPIDPRPIAERHDRWRMYRRTYPNGETQWVAYQPDQIDEPMFPAPKGDKYAIAAGGLYGRHSASGTELLGHLQVAIAKAEAAAHLNETLKEAA